MTTICIAPRCDKKRAIGALFCARHMLAPAARRGGWLSAWKRARERAAAQPEEVAMDMSNISPRLWVGARPPFDRDLPDFDVLVLCAQEIQPAVLGFGRQVLRVPLPDSALTTEETRRALIGGRRVAEALVAGNRVLVTCQQGMNRSALVASLALGHVTRMTAPQIITLVRSRRTPGVPADQGALRNPHFCDLIGRFVGARQAQWRSSAAQAARRRPR